MFKKKSLLFKLLIGIILGIIIGVISKKLEIYLVVRILNTISTLFGSFLNYSIPLIIIGFITTGISDMGKNSGKLLTLTAIISYISTLSSGFSAYLLGSSLLPKILKATPSITSSSVHLDPLFKISINPIMDIIAALITAFVVGIGIAYTKKGRLYEVAMDFRGIIELVVRKILVPFIPVYICGIFAKLSASGDIFSTLKAFSAVYMLIIPLQALIILVEFIVAGAITKKSPIKCLKTILPSYMMAIGTQSSVATIPVTMNCAKNNEVSKEVADFVVPLCSTIHLAGDTITLVLGSIAIMILNGQSPTPSLMLPYILMLSITMLAAPGIPGGGAYAALGLLKDMLSFNPAQQGLMIAIHFAQDSFGTATNVSGDGAIALIVDKLFKKHCNTNEVIDLDFAKEA